MILNHIYEKNVAITEGRKLLGKALSFFGGTIIKVI